ncbi:PTS transporter subunit IIC [Sporolactobacillus terrae]|uniref:PTS sugar transporter subunit IIC n=1 Tax=Sporolactobacillus terrae TaxID=269673 RepID=A0ABX5QAU2_9BACL|nr:PTS sugar transporter subunit IIC [Sporolactobacillus terrae]QAA23760.1 PTS sugar transporter subunit IIC [Sporolactobacillus terrae]QAA26731.1 PTS sugar transporter subunit IIC [Sporolactobacillus terrae]UAK15794.1 PTS sugar transporter subunit IIC [Sporolactobacillus terrae]
MKTERKQRMKDYFMDRMYKCSAGIANAILVTLGIGLLFETLGKFTGYHPFMVIGGATKVLLAPAIGAGIAYQLRANTLTMFSAMACAAIGANAIVIQSAAPQVLTIAPGQPVSGVVAAVIATYIGKKISGKTKFDMMAIPFCSVFVGGLCGVGLAAVVTPALNWVSGQITNSVQGSPLIASMVIALVWSIFLMSPASSAALAIALQLDPVSSAAALIGCTVQFVGFTVMSFKENDFGGFFAQALVTPKVQFPNLVKNPKLVIPPFVAAIVSAPIATMLLHFQVPYELGGLGLSSFIAPLNILAIQGVKGLLAFVVAGILIPGIITYVLYRAIKVAGWVKAGDLHMEVQ